MKRIFKSLSTAVVLCTMAVNAHAATVADTYGISPEGMSMGNAMTAHVSDWSSVYYNVVGLGRTRHLDEGASANELFLGYLNTQPRTKLDIPVRYEEVDGQTTNYPTNADKDLNFGSFIVGAALDLNMLYKMPEFISSSRFGLAVSLADDLSAAKMNDVEPQTHNYLRFGREAQKLMIIMGIGLGFVNDAFGLGFGVNSSFAGSGRILLEDVDVSTDAQKPRQQNKMDLKLDMSAWVAGIYLDWGRIAAPLTGLSLGFSYRNESRFEIDPFNTTAIVRVGGIPLNLELSLFDYYQPSSYVAGLSYEASDILLAVDVEYQTWAAYEVSTNHAKHYSDVLPKLKNIWIPRVGCRYNVRPEIALLLGYYYQPSFIPNKATIEEMNWLDNDKHAASVGLSYDTGLWAGFQKAVVLHIAYQLQYLVTRNVAKTDPTSLNPDYSYGGIVHTIMGGVSFL